jgi:MFS family permease
MHFIFIIAAQFPFIMQLIPVKITRIKEIFYSSYEFFKNIFTGGREIMDKKYYSLGFIGLLLGMSNSMIMQTLITTSLPTITKEFQSTAYYSWVYSSYMLASTVTIPLFGKLCDQYGYKKNYWIGGSLFLIGTLGCGISQTMLQLVLSRSIMGIGAGIVIPATYGMINELFNKEQLTKVFALMTVFQIINNGVGSILGGIFSQYLTWRIGFFLLIPVELLAFIFVQKGINKDKKMENKELLDFISGILVTSALLFIMIGFEWISKDIDLKSIITLILGVILFFIFIRRDKHLKNPILPIEMRESIALVRLLMQMLILGAALNICLVYFPLHIQQYLKQSPKAVSIFLLVLIFTMGVGSGVSGLVKKDYTKYTILGWFSLILGTLFIASTLKYNNKVIIILGLAFFGIGLGILMTLILGHVQWLAKLNKASINGVMHLARNLGGTVGVASMQICVTKNIGVVFGTLFVISIIGSYLGIKNNFK